MRAWRGRGYEWDITSNPVEKKPMEPRFTKIGADSSVLPHAATEWVANLDKTGLMWTKECIRVDSYQECAAALKKLQGTAGYEDWRLPTVEELFVLADRTRVDPAIDTEFFPETPSDWFWTSTLDVESPSGFAWLVYFGDGLSYRYGQNDDGWVRAVRVGQ